MENQTQIIADYLNVPLKVASALASQNPMQLISMYIDGHTYRAVQLANSNVQLSSLSELYTPDSIVYFSMLDLERNYQGRFEYLNISLFDYYYATQMIADWHEAYQFMAGTKLVKQDECYLKQRLVKLTEIKEIAEKALADSDFFHFDIY